MRLIKVFCFCLISFGSYSQVEFSRSVERKIQKGIDAHMGFSIYDYEPVSSMPELGLRKNHIFKVEKNDKIFGYFAVEKSMGQYDDFDFIVFFNDNLEILGVQLLNYRENYGYEISSKWWLSQFKGKKEGKRMEYKHDINGLSGATISAKSITDSVKILSKNMFFWKYMDII